MRKGKKEEIHPVAEVMTHRLFLRYSIGLTRTERSMASGPPHDCDR